MQRLSAWKDRAQTRLRTSLIIRQCKPLLTIPDKVRCGGGDANVCPPKRSSWRRFLEQGLSVRTGRFSYLAVKHEVGPALALTVSKITYYRYGYI